MKKFLTVFIFILLNGCVQNIAFLGPIFTGASTGSAYQATLSYGSGKIFRGITSKENVKSISSQKEDKDEIKAEVIEKISAALAMR
tara:strand:- start:43 stop:300 length:258 start_codon:yes stop_codon:yes gene_type:complete